MKKILNISVWLLVFAGIILLLSFAVNEQKHVNCSRLAIVFTDSVGSGLMDSHALESLIISRFDTLQGKPLDSINTSAISRMVNSHPYIKTAAVYKSLSGIVQIDVEREEPLVRIINNNDEYYYLSESGAVLPPKSGYAPMLMVATGYISESYKDIKDFNFYQSPYLEETSVFSSVHHLAQTLEKHDFLNNFIEQIYINKSGEFELIPSGGGHYILLGDASQLDKKLNNLMAFYRNGIQKMQGEVSLVNLKFTNQVVCKN